MAQTRSGQSACTRAASCARETYWGGGVKTARARALASVPLRIFVVAFAIGKIQGTQVFERDAQAGGDKVQRVVQVRQVNARQVMDERTLDFRGTHAAVQPTEEEDELQGDRQERGKSSCGGGLREDME